jgi:hypothetical protein
LGGRALSSPAQNSNALWSHAQSSQALSSLAENVEMAIVKPLSTGRLVIHSLPAGHPFGA